MSVEISDKFYCTVTAPDSSRYFYAEGYEERFEKGEAQRQLSKEFVREWLMDNGFQGKEGQTVPEMTDEIVKSISDRYIELQDMKPLVSIIMGSTSDLPVMEKAMKFLDEMEVPFEVNALSAHRTPDAVETFAKEAAGRGLKVIIAGAGMAAALPGVIAASTTLPVIGVLV